MEIIRYLLFSFNKISMYNLCSSVGRVSHRIPFQEDRSSQLRADIDKYHLIPKLRDVSYLFETQTYKSVVCKCIDVTQTL